MRVLAQRVERASVEAGEGCVCIQKGLVLSLCVQPGDRPDDAEDLAKKALELNMWPDLVSSNDQWKSNVVDNDYELIVAVQPSLGMNSPGDMKDFVDAVQAEKLYEAFVAELQSKYRDEMIVKAPMDRNVTVEITAEGHYMFDLGPEERTSRKRALEPTPKRAPKSKRMPRPSTASRPSPMVPPPVVHNIRVPRPPAVPPPDVVQNVLVPRPPPGPPPPHIVHNVLPPPPAAQ